MNVFNKIKPNAVPLSMKGMKEAFLTFFKIGIVTFSTFIGYKLNKKKGAFCTTLGAALPSFLIILLIAMFFHQFADNKVVAAMFRGIRPAVVALIAAPTFRLAKSARITLTNCWIPIACALAIWALGVSPILIIIVAAVAGYVYGQFIKPTE